jgi:AcrR family transcriptional regulator
MPRIRAESIAEHRALTRSEVLQAAEDLFAEFGYEDTSFGDISAAVGIGRTTLYDYFVDKDDLLASLVEDRLPSTIQQMFADISTAGDPRERLRELMVKMIEFVAVDPTLGLLLHREVPKISEEAQERVAAAHAGLAKEFADVYRAGVSAGQLKLLPGGLAGRFLNDMIMSAAKALIDSDDPRQKLPEVTTAAVDLLLNGLSAN